MDKFQSMTPVALRYRALREVADRTPEETQEYLAISEAFVDELEIRLAANHKHFRDGDAAIAMLQAQHQRELTRVIASYAQLLDNKQTPTKHGMFDWLFTRP